MEKKYKSLAEFKIGDLVGKGGFAKVYKVRTQLIS